MGDTDLVALPEPWFRNQSEKGLPQCRPDLGGFDRGVPIPGHEQLHSSAANLPVTRDSQDRGNVGVLFTPFRARAAHVVQLRAIGIENPLSQSAPNSDQLDHQVRKRPWQRLPDGRQASGGQLTSESSERVVHWRGHGVSGLRFSIAENRLRGFGRQHTH
jgi:hypothetical protein